MGGEDFGGFQIGGFTPGGGSFGTTSTSGPSFGSFAPQSGGFPGTGGGFPGTGGGFPGTGGGDLGGIANILQTFGGVIGSPDEDKSGGVYEIGKDPEDPIEQVIKEILGNETDTSAGQTSGFDFTKLIKNALGKITGKDVAGAAAGATAAKLSYDDRKRLIEQIEKDIKQQRADVAMFRERFKNVRGTGRATGAPTGPADVVKRPGQAMGGIMDVPLRTNPQGVTEMDFRKTGGFVPPVGIKEKADDIPAMLSNNEFVFTADAVRAAGGGSVNKGAEKMYSLMKQLEGQA